MIESTSTAGAETTEAAPTTEAALPTASSLLTDGQGGEQPGAGEAAQTSTEAEGKPTAGEKPTEQGAPESYADFTLPDGVTLDAAVADEAKALAKDLGLSQEKAQKVADLLAKQSQAVAPAATEAFKATQQAQVQSIHDQWATETKADKEVGGEQLAENLAKARAAMEATTTPQLQELLKRTGLGNNVEVIRHFLRIAPAFSQDKHVPGTSAPQEAKAKEAVLYDKTT